MTRNVILRKTEKKKDFYSTSLVGINKKRENYANYKTFANLLVITKYQSILSRVILRNGLS